VIGGIVVGFGGYLLYNTVNKAGANSSRVVTEPLLAEAMAARRRDSAYLYLRIIYDLLLNLQAFTSLSSDYSRVYIRRSPSGLLVP
jgi:hypothetical protein